MMRLDYKDFLTHSGMDETDAGAIPEYEIIASIASLLPASTTICALIRFWRRAFAEQPDEARRGVYRVRQGCGSWSESGKTLRFRPLDFIAHTNMNRTDESWFAEFTIMQRIAAMVPASVPVAAVRKLWRDSFQRAPLSQRLGVAVVQPVPDIYEREIHSVTSSL